MTPHQMYFSIKTEPTKPQYLAIPLYPPVHPDDLKVFDCPLCHTANAVVEDAHGFHCRTCKQMFSEARFDDWHDDTDPDD